MNQHDRVEARTIAAAVLLLCLSAFCLYGSITDQRGGLWWTATTCSRILQFWLLWKIAPRQRIRIVTQDTADAIAKVVEHVAPARFAGELRRERRRRERLRRAGGRCAREAKRQRWALYGNLCWVCHAPATHSDHVIAVARGGSNWPANIRPACRRCNCSKGAADWRGVQARAMGLPSPGRLP